MRLLISEVLQKVIEAETEKEKINLLRVNYSPALEDVFKWAYDSNVVFFTDKIPPYTPDQSPEGLAYTSLYNEHKKFYLFLENTKVDNERKRILLIQMLEALCSNEAKVLEWVILKNIPNLPLSVISKAYPGFLSKPIKIPLEAL